MKILYGTTNQAKLDSMKRIVDTIGIEIVGLNDLDTSIPIVDETGKNPLENAILKAKIYYNAFKMPVFSCDSGLYFDDLDDSLQPGTHIRRVNGTELTDEEMIDYYSNLSKQFNNQLVGKYKNAISFIYNDQHVFNSMDASLMTESFMLVDKPHSKRVKGYPLDAISVDCCTKQYYYDLEDKSVDDSAINNGFKEFFENAISSMNIKVKR